MKPSSPCEGLQAQPQKSSSVWSGLIREEGLEKLPGARKLDISAHNLVLCMAVLCVRLPAPDLYAASHPASCSLVVASSITCGTFCTPAEPAVEQRSCVNTSRGSAAFPELVRLVKA